METLPLTDSPFLADPVLLDVLPAEESRSLRLRAGTPPDEPLDATTHREENIISEGGREITQW